MSDKKREEILRLQEELIVLQEKVHDDLMRLPNVVGTAVGLKVVGGKLTDEIVLKVYVQKKKEENKLLEGEKIPPIIEGVKTDVLEIGDIKLEDDSKEYRPLCGGIQIDTGNYEDEKKGDKVFRKLGQGTLGCLAIDNTDDSVVLLTNYHVILELGAEVGDPVGQPDGPCDSCCCVCCDIATIVRGVKDTEVDCAIARLTDEYQNNYVNEILEIGSVFGTAPAVFIGPDNIVRKRGRTTGLTEGTVSSINKTFTIKSITYTGQIEVTPNPPHARFSAPGDSGSVYVNRFNQVVGLHFSGDGTVGNGNPIAKVLSKLDISIPEEGTLASIPLKAASNERQRESFIDELSSLVKSYNFGEQLINLVNAHRIEVIKLINTNREVKIAWNKHKGPIFMAHLMEKGKDRRYKLPSEIEGISSNHLLLKMSTALEENGSMKLKSDIEKHSINTIKLFNTIVEENA